MNATESFYKSLQDRESRNSEDYEVDLAQRTPTLKEVLLRMRKVHIKEMDRLQKRVNAIDKRVDELELEEIEREANICRECGHTPETGACYYCRMD